jgi:inosine/xanthosine triphosphatase
MDVAVGSANPVKRAAVERALDGRITSVRAVTVDSGVPEQPRGRQETITGAENRARRAREETGAVLGIGIEGGVETLNDRDGLYLIMWAAATDGDRIERGGGPTIRLPAAVAERVRAGGELGPELDALFDREGIARQEGAAGLLTDGLTDREQALAQAVAAAVGPFFSDAF